MTAASKYRSLEKLQDRDNSGSPSVFPVTRGSVGKKRASAPTGDGGVWVQAPTQGVQG
jgi:hypothetical protein